VWPLLAVSCGDGWPLVFARHRDGHEPVGALRDGWDVARTLRDLGELGTGGATELAEREASMRYDGGSAPRVRPFGAVRRLAARARGHL
jgi:hypothetical protein